MENPISDRTVDLSPDNTFNNNCKQTNFTKEIRILYFIIFNMSTSWFYGWWRVNGTIWASQILDKIQALPGPFDVSDVYSPPRLSISTEQYKYLFSSHGDKFVAGGDCKANTLIGLQDVLLLEAKSLAHQNEQKLPSSLKWYTHRINTNFQTSICS